MSRPLTQEQALADVAAKEARAQSACRPYPFRDHRTVAELPKAETRRKQRATPGLTAKQDELLAILPTFSDRDLIREIKARGYQVEAIR